MQGKPFYQLFLSAQTAENGHTDWLDATSRKPNDKLDHKKDMDGRIKIRGKRYPGSHREHTRQRDARTDSISQDARNRCGQNSGQKISRKARPEPHTTDTLIKTEKGHGKRKQSNPHSGQKATQENGKRQSVSVC
ncbi:hypothetical protein PSDVSF_06170 [Pseudodesulfovibrio sediminis]|uniref:Uncharacterized protein n=1 Tax=Pseudodesulfovibrio sediminis TaxID=2810563 RepID=A0ABN6EPR3_9BACT|nr:hypothetical protein PSDVSF_06170 [Pseudodesulfovibrio sediminis]